MIDWLRNFIDNYTNDMYFPAIEIKDIVEILILTVILYEIMLWIKNTKAWMLLRGIIMLGAFIFFAWLFQMHTILYLKESGGTPCRCGLNAGLARRRKGWIIWNGS